MGVNPADDLVERCARRENGANTFGEKRCGVFLGDDATAEDDDVVGAASRKGIEDRGKQGVVRARHNREPHRVDIFLNGRHSDHVRRLMKPRVDDLEARIAQRPRDDFGATIVAVETRLGD